MIIDHLHGVIQQRCFGITQEFILLYVRPGFVGGCYDIADGLVTIFYAAVLPFRIELAGDELCCALPGWATQLGPNDQLLHFGLTFEPVIVHVF